MHGDVEIMEGDMTNKDCVLKAVEDCQYVIHNAHPNPDIKVVKKVTEEITVVPAELGMKNIL